MLICALVRLRGKVYVHYSVYDCVPTVNPLRVVETQSSDYIIIIIISTLTSR